MLNFAHHFVIYRLLNNGAKKNHLNTDSHTKEKPYMINSQFLQNWEGKKGQQGEQNMCLYVCKWNMC